MAQKLSKPTFIVVGAAKCGTTSLYHYLDQHPEVFMSRIKETNHFSTDINPDDFSKEYKLHEARKAFDLEKWFQGGMKEKEWGWYVKKRQDYYRLFSLITQQKAAGEISNSYLYSETAAAEIKRELPDAKIIMILRNPIDRMYSHYLANLRDGRTVLPFMDEINADREKKVKGWGKSHLYIELGLYYEQVKRFIDLFESDQIKIYFQDDLKKDPQGLINDLFSFIDVNTSVKINLEQSHNEARIPKNKYLIRLLSVTGIKKKVFRMIPSQYKDRVKSTFFSPEKPKPLTAEERKIVGSWYHDDLAKLSVLLNKDFSKWI